LARFPLLQSCQLWHTLVRQELAARYRGTLLGRAWPVLMPLLLLGVYGFVFGAVFRARWPGLAEGDHLGFTLNLFAGLLLHGLMAESVGQAPGLMRLNGNFVRKVVFPLPVLVAVPLGTALVHATVGLALLALVNAVLGTGVHASLLAVPLVLLPWVLLLYGLSLLLAALGVYLRDLTQVTGVLVMLVLFTGTVFFPRDMVPAVLGPVVDLNPISWPVEALRGALLHGHWPDASGFAGYCAAALAVLAVGWGAFARLRHGFADVL
jgi:lipopolysaccharide transport system permease protein